MFYYQNNSVSARWRRKYSWIETWFCKFCSFNNERSIRNTSIIFFSNYSSNLGKNLWWAEKDLTSNEKWKIYSHILERQSLFSKKQKRNHKRPWNLKHKNCETISFITNRADRTFGKYGKRFSESLKILTGKNLKSLECAMEWGARTNCVVVFGNSKAALTAISDVTNFYQTGKTFQFQRTKLNFCLVNNCHQ